MRTNVFREEAVAEREMEELKNKLQEYWRSSKPDAIISKSYNCALHFL